MNELTIRCSGLARVMTCAGSLFFTDLPEDTGSEPAREGTACGEMFEAKLLGKTYGEKASNGYQFNEDMEFYTNALAENIKNGRAATPVLCEQRIDWQPCPGIWIRGQYDASYFDGLGRLCVDDLKYGWGIVEVKPNWQLLGYAIGEVTRLNLWGHEGLVVVLRILQPRPHHEDGSIREWVLTREELYGYYQQIVTRMQAIAAGEKSLVTSDKCRYCKAATVCPAFNKNFYRALEYTHEFTEDRMTNEEIAFQLDLVSRAQEILKIKAESLQSLAIDKIRKSELIPNYVIETKLGDRKWKSSITPESFQAMTGRDIVKRDMLSPAQAEKLGVPKKFIDKLVDRFEMGPKLVKKDVNEIGRKIFGEK